MDHDQQPEHDEDRAERLAPGDPRGRHERRRARIAEAGGEDGLVAYFKERVYATFTGLAIVLVVAGKHPEPQHAFLALVFGVLGIVVAGFVSEIVGHLVVHGGFSSRAELIVPLRVASAALGTVVLPAALVGAAWLGWIEIDAALRIASWIYIGTLVVIGLLVVRGARLRWWQTLLALGLLVALALLVLLLQTLAKSV
ncbi:fatty acid desaturase [Microbacterium terrae]|uniref:Uncharacterized protein n=1 Tax=Microbacterium terrae TaxID=69369 RepID=A0A0M2H957_9MICO|nr:hypothetical protein [Microbacterium terrae]KJL40535.1 hypothetical protein RS81_01619 [Microbacterium terrae]MBP1079140.1 fatty acid desaturase [Microbacterium terrae]GLJ98541.1 hypothetical protein GCM10017594_17380 [Microbacterium terrae]